jgi:hypothetical protein
LHCTDPFISFLKDQGYCAVRVPKADVRPLQLLARQGATLDRLGDLGTVLVAGPEVPLPALHLNLPAPSLNGRRTGDLSYGIGLSLLGDVISAMGGSKIGLDAKYQQAHRVVFEFTDVLEDRIELAELDQFLAAADVSPNSRHVADMLEADELYVITSTIKSHLVAVGASNQAGIAVPVGAPVVQGLVGATVRVSAEDGTSSGLTYKGPVPLVFGFQAVRLIYRDGRYSAFRQLPAGSTMRGMTETGGEPESLATDGAFARLRGW